jgi:hypothetical protein
MQSTLAYETKKKKLTLYSVVLLVAVQAIPLPVLLREGRSVT